MSCASSRRTFATSSAGAKWSHTAHPEALSEFAIKSAAAFSAAFAVYVSTRQHTAAYVRLREDTTLSGAFACFRRAALRFVGGLRFCQLLCHALALHDGRV
jgi:hypothetical protein